MPGNRTIATIVLASAAYAVVRYHVFKGVGWEHLPLYTFNKVAGLSGLALIGIAPWRSQAELRKRLGTTGFVFVVMHCVMSLLILNPAYFGKFYQSGGEGLSKMTWQAESSMLAGVSGVLILASLFCVSLRISSRQQSRKGALVPGLGRIVLLTTAAHVALMGYEGWAAIDTWPGSLPPITLVAFALAVSFFLVRTLAGRTTG